MGDRIRLVSPVAGKNTVRVQAGGSRFEIARAAAVDLGLEPGTELSEPLRAALVAAAARREVAARVLRWLRGRPRTEFEVERYLDARGVAAPVAAAILVELRQQGCIDDERYARWFVNARRARRPAAVTVLRHELLACGVAPHVADAALAPLQTAGEKQLALGAARKRLRALGILPPAQAAMLLARFLGARGFGEETVREVCRDLVGREPGESDTGPGPFE